MGSRDLAEGMVEFAIRATGEKQRVPVAEAVRHVQQYLSAQRAAEASGGS